MMGDVDLTPVFKALADPTRRHVLDLLRERNGQTLGELCGGLAMTRQAASQHLAVLEAANLVSTSWRGRERLHHLNPVQLHEVGERWIETFDRRYREEVLGQGSVIQWLPCVGAWARRRAAG